MPIKPTDRILGPPRGSPGGAVTSGATRRDALAGYLAETYRLAPLTGIDPAIVVAQSALETSNWSDHWWTERLNPAGIGITGDPAQNAASMTWRSGADAARAQIVHLWLYAQGWPLHPALEPHAHLDPRRTAIPPHNQGAVVTVADLGGKWAVVQDYGQRIANRARHIFPDLPDQHPAGDGTGGPTNGGTDMDVIFEKSILINRIDDYGLLVEGDNFMTVHENGNEDGSPYGERSFMRNGGGSQRVSYHFTVGVEGGKAIILQLLPVGYRGRHAGNAAGNAISAAVETCQAPPGALSDMTQAALRELLYMLYTHDPRIDWGPGEHRFSPDRTQGHKDWPGANPGCPEFMTRQWGGVEPVVAAVRARLDGAPDPEPEIIHIGDTLETTVALNLRAAAGLSHPVLAVLPAGTRAVVSGAWSQVDGYGWLPVTSDLGNGAIAQGDSSGPWVRVVARAPEPEPEPQPGIDYPEYLTGALAAHLFGSVTVDGTTYQYDPTGPVSRLWRIRGTATGLWPRLEEVWHDSGHRYFRFGDGSVVVDPEGAPRPQYIGTVEALTDILDDIVDDL